MQRPRGTESAAARRSRLVQVATAQGIDPTAKASTNLTEDIGRARWAQTAEL